MGYIDNFRLAERVAIITGGSRGLGRSIAIGMGEVGATVVVTSRNKILIEETAQEIISRGGDAVAIPVDVKNDQNIEHAVTYTKDRFGRVDILVNNAGMAPMNAALEIGINEWNEVIRTNLTANFLFSKLVVAKAMKSQKKGKIINIGSVLGLRASMMSAHYCSSKAGLEHLTRTLAFEWARYNINVNCIAPGFFDTDMTKELQENEVQKKFLNSKIPFKRLGTPEEIVPAAIFLASESANYITGATLLIDGGYATW
jgi:NAD(P)-dependent dehydrogenase (short-subunit alcohol dehydrogenase family)